MVEPSMRIARPSRTTLLLVVEARCTMVGPSLQTARPSRTTLLLVVEARCTMIMEPALELTACAEEIPQTILMGLAISVLTVRDYNIFIGDSGYFETSLVAVEILPIRHDLTFLFFF